MSNVREQVEEDVLNDTECSRNEEQLDDSFSETLPPINPPASSTQNKSVRRERQKENTVSNIDKVLEHLNKKQKVTTSALDAIEMLMLGHAKTIKTFSPRRQATAKQQISNIIGNLEMDQIDENENYHGSRSTNQHVIHHEDRDYPTTTDQHVVNYRSNNEDVVYHEDRDYPPTTDQHVAYPTQTQNTDAINLSVENCAQTYTNLGRYSW